MRKGMVCLGLAVAAVAAWGMPTPSEIERVKPLVAELMASQKNAKPQEAAEAALGFIPDAESEAAKFLLYRTALDLYAKSGDDEKTAETFNSLVDTIQDMPLGMQGKILQEAMRAIGKTTRPARTEEVYRHVSTLVAVDRELQKALQALKANPKDAAAHLRAGNALVIFGEWPKALEHLSVSGSAFATLAEEERTERSPIGEIADGWWKVSETTRNVTLKDAYRSHAVDLYRKAIVERQLTGLKKSLAEQKITEFANGSGRVQRGRVGLYCVIDLSGGPKAKQYTVSYLKEPPEGGFNTDAFKTTKLVLRRIDPGAFEMCGSYAVTLTKAYYIGVFEVTQRQYELVMGENPSQEKGDTHPVEKVSYDQIRGASEGAKWPTSSAVDAASFMGKLRARTRLAFDLPTEAQWEFACRAGTKSTYNNGGDSEDDLKQLGRYQGDQSDGKGGGSKKHTTVGSYTPNAWGLYDMHGNVWEVCLDWQDDLSGGVIDPKGADSGLGRVVRGGCWSEKADDCTSSSQYSYTPAFGSASYGFRLARTVEK